MERARTVKHEEGRSLLEIKIKRLPHFPEHQELPRYESEAASGVDLRAAIPEALTLGPCERILLPTGLSIAIPRGFEAQIRPRSGLAMKLGLTLLNSPGTIDADYRGELKLLLVNLSQAAVNIAPGDRIGQMVFAPVVQASWVEVSDLDATQRGEGGFGHTGIK